MNSKGGKSASPDPARGVRSPLKWTVLVILGLCLAALAWRLSRTSSAPSPGPGASAPAPEPTPVAQRTPSAPRPQPADAGTETTASEPSSATVRTAAPPVAVAPVAPAPIDPALAGLVAGFKQLGGTNLVPTPEALAAWRTNFQQLVQGGAAAVPALKAFLDQNVDYAFSRDTWQALGFPSARIAAFDALRQIGGPEAMAVMETTLGETAVPKEIAALARNLEDSAPGEYREKSLAAAREALATAGAAKDPQVDVAPLFEVFQHYGDASVIPELEKATGQWKYYAVNALANLPEGAGLPALLKMADPSTGSGNRLMALETVARLAAENPTMKDFLVSQVTGKQIQPNYWPYLSGPLTGDQYFPVDSVITQYPTLQSWSDLKTTRIPYGNQNLYSVPGDQSQTAEGIQQRLAFVDDLLKATSDPAALQALQQARNTLQKRASRPPPPAPAAAPPAAGDGTGP